jgi:hypothetical protein
MEISMRALAATFAVVLLSVGTFARAGEPLLDPNPGTRWIVDAWRGADAPPGEPLAAVALPRPWLRDDSAAQDPTIPNHPALTDRFFFGLGAYYATSTTEARLDSSVGIGTNVDFEDLLGLDERTWSPQGIARFRLSHRWRLELEYFQVDRSNSRLLAEDIDWGDETFPAGTEVETEFNIAVARLSAGYSFFRTQDKEVGIGLGFHITDIEAKLSGTGGSAESGALLAPLPVISLYGQFALTDIWAVASRLDVFRISYDPYEGSISSIGLDLLCQPWNHFGFGFGWRGLEFEAKAEGSDWEGSVRTQFSGPIAFLSFSF